ncbi:GGDEF domain-containing protein [Thermosipho ferrireducens]|uniref:GGDEF domain-containing protein n=1 Tax=Thermosipho ferrireducens TaxID=2571116 RepID=A0ABX7S6N1_9BACT|nr:GGDEF domain-containing protein [Thermosipho ferrireducens]QTA37420.1 GGDEF domain-containing protein [Thermosipho ferrireducens]
MEKIGEIILQASEKLKDKALLSLFSMSVVDLIGVLEVEEFLDKLVRTIYNIVPSVEGVEVKSVDKNLKYGALNNVWEIYEMERIKILIYAASLSDFEKTLLKFIFGVAELHVRNVYKYQSLKERASHDELTGALSRQVGIEFLEKRFSDLKRYSQVASLVFVDLDGLKMINDKEGHLAGDKKLQEFVFVCKEFIRKGDFVIRWGGDEFVLFLNTSRGKEVIERIKAVVSMSFSYGVVNIPDGFESVKQAIDRADKLMYQQKFMKKFKKSN